MEDEKNTGTETWSFVERNGDTELRFSCPSSALSQQNDNGWQLGEIKLGLSKIKKVDHEKKESFLKNASHSLLLVVLLDIDISLS